jgi:hypothetical protein
MTTVMWTMLDFTVFYPIMVTVVRFMLNFTSVYEDQIDSPIRSKPPNIWNTKRATVIHNSRIMKSKTSSLCLSCFIFQSIILARLTVALPSCLFVGSFSDSANLFTYCKFPAVNGATEATVV